MLDVGKCLALAFSLMILAQAYVVRRYVGTWVFPACLFGLFWFGYTFVPLAALWWVPIQPLAVAYIFACTLAFSVGALACDWRTAFAINSHKRDAAAAQYGNRFLKNVFYFSSCASLVFLMLNLMDQGISPHDLVFDLQGSALAYAKLLYSESVSDNIYGRLSTAFAYLGPALGGLLYPHTRTLTARARVMALAFLPAVMVAVTETTKGLLFLCIALFYAGLLVNRVANGEYRLFRRGGMTSRVIGGVVVIAVVTGALMLRGLNSIEDQDVLLGRLAAYLASYSCGHLYAFSDWFTYAAGGASTLAYPHDVAAPGFYTFMSWFRLLGNERVMPLGVYDDYFTYGDLLTTNIYTMYRGLILDFGFGGSMLFWVALSIPFHLLFRKLLVAPRPVLPATVFIFMVGFFYMSFVISALSWNRFYIAFMALWIVLALNKYIAQPVRLRFALVP